MLLSVLSHRLSNTDEGFRVRAVLCPCDWSTTCRDLHFRTLWRSFVQRLYAREQCIMRYLVLGTERCHISLLSCKCDSWNLPWATASGSASCPFLECARRVALHHIFDRGTYLQWTKSLLTHRRRSPCDVSNASCS